MAVRTMTPQEEREAIARIIDPGAWGEMGHDDYLRRADEWFAKGRTTPGDALVDGYRLKAAEMVKPSLAKADAILALRSQDEREVLTSIAKVSEWIGFSAGCMKDGLPWDDEATTLRDEAKAALAVLGAALRSQDEYLRGVEDAARVADADAGRAKADTDRHGVSPYGQGWKHAGLSIATAIRALATSDDSAGGLVP